MSKDNFPLENLIVTVPTIEDGAKSAQLELDTSKVKDFDEKAKVVEAGVGHLRTMTNTMTHHNAKHAHDLFEEYNHLDTVESDLAYGGVELNVVTHRNFQEGNGETLTFVTQAQAVTNIGSDVLDVLGELDFND